VPFICTVFRTLARTALLAFALGAVAASASQKTPEPLTAADAAMQAGQFADAALKYERWLAVHPEAGEVLFALGTCYIQLGRSSDAAATLRQYVRRKPDSASGYALLGIALLDAANTVEAKAALESAIRINSSQINAVEALARIHLVEGDPSKALSLLRSIRSPDPHLLAEALMRGGDPKAAATLLDDRLAGNHAAAVQTYALAGMAHIKAGDLERAAEICEAGMRLYPNSEIEGMYLTLPAAVLGRRMAARLERLQSAPEVSELIAVGRALTDVDPARKTRALELARRVLEQAIEMAPADPSARYNYGRVLRQGNIGAALGAWTKALALQPGDDLAMQIHTQIGKAKEDLSDMPAAEQAYKTAFEINRRLPARVPEAALEYVRFLQLQARTRDAEAILNEVVGWNPWSPKARGERARLLAAKGDWNDVVTEGEFLLRNAADDDDLLRLAHFLLARAYFRLNQPDKAQVHRAWLESR
jgi:tetratricopeptide (TPR) repeat protein